MKRVILGLLLCSMLPAAAPNRLPRAIHAEDTFVLTNHVPHAVSFARDEGTVESSFRLNGLELHFRRTAAQQRELDALLAAQQNRTNPEYHKWLTPEEFGARFGMSERDLNAVTEWLRGAGIADVQAAKSRTFLRISVDASTINNAFGVTVHQFSRNGVRFYSNANDPVLPRELEGVVMGIRGLNNLHPHPFIRRIKPQLSIGLTGNHFLAPKDLATIYNLQPIYASGTDGSGQKIAVVGQSDIALSDIEAFQTASGLPIKDPEIVLVGEDPGTYPDDESEADLDLEWSGAVARGAGIIYVNSVDVFTSAIHAIDRALAPVISISYGICEPRQHCSRLPRRGSRLWSLLEIRALLPVTMEPAIRWRSMALRSAIPPAVQMPWRLAVRSSTTRTARFGIAPETHSRTYPK